MPAKRRSPEIADAIISVDIGGTFTDLVLLSPSRGVVASCKVRSTPPDFSIGIRNGVQQMLSATRVDAAMTRRLHHATTVVTNCILEGKGAKTALLTTRGFRDILEIGRLRVPRFYDLDYQKPTPLVPRRWRLEVDERIDSQGKIIRELQNDEVRRLIANLEKQGIGSVAVCLINSYVNPEHEVAIGRLLSEEFPQLSYTLSSDLLREFGEYERTSTTVINSYVTPQVHHYFAGIRDVIDGLGLECQLLTMNSNGGLVDFDTAAKQPAFMVESGPAAGVVAAHALADVTGHRDLITFDMGGTSAKASLIENGHYFEAAELEVGGGISFARRLVGGSGFPIRSSVIDLAEVGAGGGSIAWFDPGGGLHVGPDSAGADPGPACYDRGGDKATVTDANVILGYLSDCAIAGGAVPINRDRACWAIETQVAKRIGASLETAAYGIFSIAAATMMRAIKAVSTERGRAPEDFSLLAFGGNGPLFAAQLATALGIRRIIIPRLAGVFSAAGLLTANVTEQHIETVRQNLNRLTMNQLSDLLDSIESNFREQLEAKGQSVVAMQRTMDMRYRGQRHTIPVHLGIESIGDGDIRALLDRFHAEHLRTYGHQANKEEVELVTVRLVAVKEFGSRLFDASAWARRTTADGPDCSRAVYFGDSMCRLETPVLTERAKLPPEGMRGPAIFEEYDSTTVVPPLWSARLDVVGNIVLTHEV